MSFSIKIWVSAILLGVLCIGLMPFSKQTNVVLPSPFVHVVGPDVRWQPAGSYDWTQLRSGEISLQQSGLMTGQNSEARLQIPYGQYILNENTALSFTVVSAERTQIKFEKGVLYGAHTKFGQETNIELNEQNFVLKGRGYFRLHQQSARTFLKIISGDFDLCGKKQCVQHFKNQPDLYELTTNGTLFKADSLARIGFEDGKTYWTKTKEFLFKISDLKADNITLVDRRARSSTALSGNQSLMSSLAPGNYELRRGTDFLRFQVRALANPQITFIRSEQGHLRLSWSDLSDSEYYTVIIRENDELGRIVYQQNRNQPDAETPRLPKGMYHIHVASFRDDRPDPVLLSAPSFYFHDRNGEPLQPQISFSRKAYNFELQPEDAPATNGFESTPVVSIEWETNLPTMKYQVQIAKDYSFEQVEFETQSSTNHFVWERSQPGKWFVRVRPWRDWSPTANWSETVQLRVIYGAPIVKIERLAKNKKAELSWVAHPSLRKFEIWNGPQRRIVQERNKIFQLPRGLYVRVRGVDDNGWPLTSWSDLPSMEKNTQKVKR